MKVSWKKLPDWQGAQRTEELSWSSDSLRWVAEVYAKARDRVGTVLLKR